jgi:16S rRNA (cytidine1402-2'-O)-methyltransferase
LPRENKPIVAAVPSSGAIIAQAAAAAAAAQQFPAGALYVVATPIGNLADLTLRAVHVLGAVDAVACEDTRVSAGLLNHLGLHKPLIALHEHNEREAAQRVIERLQRGERIAYVSDAGTPAVSDPGAALVAAVQAAGLRCVPIAGISSVIAALSVAGDAAAGGFCFVGFAPSKAAERGAWVTALAAHHDETVVLFESPHRVAALLLALAETMPQRRVTIARELTKQFEEVVTLAAADAPSWQAADSNRSRGEFVLVLHSQPRPAQADAVDARSEQALTLLMEHLPLKQAVAVAAQLSSAPRNALYQRALRLRDEGPPET